MNAPAAPCARCGHPREDHWCGTERCIWAVRGGDCPCAAYVEPEA